MKKTLPISIASAQYRHSNVSSYQGNPLILALPDRIEPERFITVMSRIIQAGINDVDMPDDDRIASLRNLRQLLIMTPQHLDLYNELYDLMCHGYVDRNPTRVEVIAWSYDIADSHIDIENIKRPLLDMIGTATTADAMFMTGISGNGKSRAIESILTNLFPTVIEHQTDSLIKQTFKKRFPLMRMVTRNINQGKKGRHSDLLTVQQYLDSGNNTLAIKHLQSFMSSSELTSDTAHAVKNDIENLIASNEFSEADLQKLAKIKAELDGKRESKRSPQTLEHNE